MYIVLIKLNFISLFPKYLHTMVTYIESLASKFQWHFDIMQSFNRGRKAERDKNGFNDGHPVNFSLSYLHMSISALI